MHRLWSLTLTLTLIDECHLNAQAVVHARAERERLFNQKLQTAVEQNVTNLEQVISRLDKIDEVKDNSVTLRVMSNSFAENSKKVADEVWWHKCRTYAIFYILIAFILAGVGFAIYEAAN